VRLALVACLAALALAGCAGPFDDDGNAGSFERMQSFSVVLVGNGLLTAGAEPLTSAVEPPPEPTAPPALSGQLVADETPPAPDDPVELPAEVETAVVAALARAAPAAERDVRAVNGRLEAAAGRGAGPPLQRLAAAARRLERDLAAVEDPPAPVLALARASRRVANAARDLRTAVAAGRTPAAQQALERYAAQAATANGVVASFALDGWPAERRLFP